MLYKIIKNAINEYFSSINEESLPDYFDFNNIDDFYKDVPDEYFYNSNHPYIKNEYKVFIKNPLNETSVKLYPKSVKGELAIENIQKILYLKNEWINIIKYNTNDNLPRCIKITVPISELTTHFEKTLNIAFHKCGYFQAGAWSCNKGNKNYRSFQYEAFYFNDYKLKDFESLYHITEFFRKENILKNGFIPSSSNKFLKYPPRNYFFLFPDKNIILNLFYNKGKKFPIKTKGTNKIVIFELYANNLINSDIAFFSDPMCELNSAVYTYDYLHSKYITDIREDII